MALPLDLGNGRLGQVILVLAIFASGVVQWNKVDLLEKAQSEIKRDIARVEVNLKSDLKDVATDVRDVRDRVNRAGLK